MKILMLVNDIEANGRGIAALGAGDLAELAPGVDDATGARAVVSAGTGLGEAALWWDGHMHRPAASEGGSASFAPRSELEVELSDAALLVAALLARDTLPTDCAVAA